MISIDSKKMDPKIRSFSELYFDYYVSERGIDRFRKDILDDMKNKKPGWLRDSFAKIAEKYQCKDLDMNYDGWLKLTEDEDVSKMYELMYQVRLGFAELYRKKTTNDINNKTTD